MQTARNPSRSAFTLLEIMLVVSIIALLLASGIYMMKGNLEFGQSVTAEGHIRNLETQLKLYYGMNGFYPSTEQGLAALVTQPQTEPKPRKWRQYLSQPLIDPWGKEYFYVRPGNKNPDSYDVFSSGPDQKPGTPDDIGNWK